MLGSISDAEDAVQDAWLRLHRSDADAIDNLAGWLTTVVARICLDRLRARTARREEPRGVHLPDPIVTSPDGAGPEDSAVLVDSVGLALIVVLETLRPAERIAFVLHDMFAVPFDQIAPIVGRSADATKKLASRARQRVRSAGPAPEPDPARRGAVVAAFLAASRSGDFAALVKLLHPEAVLRADQGPGQPGVVVRGAEQVAGQAREYAHLNRFARPVLVNGAPGLAVVIDDEPFAVLSVEVAGGQIVELDILADAARLRRLARTYSYP